MKDTETEMMFRKKELEKFNRLELADRTLVNDLIIKAKGPKRSMRQFAIECGVSPSTFSRILQADSGPVSNDILYRVAEMADPDSGIDLETIMYANGMSKRNGTSYDEEKNYEKHVRTILLNELFDRNFSIWHMEAAEDDDHRRLLDYIADIRFVTDAIPSLHYFKEDELTVEEKGFANWTFDICRFSNNLSYRQNAIRIYQRMLMVWGCYYSKQLGTDKISFVIDDQELYDELEEILCGIELRDWTSIILVDLNKGRVEKEYNIPIEGFDAIPEVFKTPIAEKDVEEKILSVDDDWYKLLDKFFDKKRMD